MLLALIPLCLAGAAGAQQTPVQEFRPVERWSHCYALYMGQSEFDSDFWDPVDRPIVFGMEYALVHPVGLGLELGLNLGFDEEESGTVDFGGIPFEKELTSSLFEAAAGARFERRLGRRWGLYAGGGIAWVSTEVETLIEEDLIVADDSDSDFGYYYHGGVKFWINRDFFVGLDYRSLQGTELELESFDTEADYGQFAVVLGGGR